LVFEPEFAAQTAAVFSVTLPGLQLKCVVSHRHCRQLAIGNSLPQ
jgi:hypothetical protein